MIKTRTGESPEVDLTPMIDIVFQLVIFFMVVMAIAVVYGVAIKFPPPGSSQNEQKKKEKRVVVYVQADYIDKGHTIIQDGILKLNGEELPLAVSVNDRSKWEQERTEGYLRLKLRIEELLEEGYKNDMLLIQGDMKTYHKKIMHVVDIGKELDFENFSLVPPSG